MIPSQSLFIPLYFDEAETDLWLALQQIEPEKRSSFIKETLRQVLLGINEEELFRHSLHKISEDVLEIHDDGYQSEEVHVEVLKNEVKQPETFSLEDLFVQEDALFSDEKTDVYKNREEVDSISGYEYMMKHIIGTEEDEAVLMILRGKEN